MPRSRYRLRDRKQSSCLSIPTDTGQISNGSCALRKRRRRVAAIHPSRVDRVRRSTLYAILCGDLNAGFGNGSAEAAIVEEGLQMCNLSALPFINTCRTHYCETNLDVIASNIDEMVVEFGQTAASGFTYHDL